MKFLDKWMELENIILSEIITKEHTWYVLSDKRILVQKLGIPKIQFTDIWKTKAWILWSFLEGGTKYP